MFDSDSVINRNFEITTVGNTLKKIHISTTLLNESTSISYDNIYGCFAVLLQKYATYSGNNINHLTFIQEWKSNMGKSDC